MLLGGIKTIKQTKHLRFNFGHCLCEVVLSLHDYNYDYISAGLYRF